LIRKIYFLKKYAVKIEKYGKNIKNFMDLPS